MWVPAPKFDIGETVFSRLHDKAVLIEARVWDREKKEWQYRFQNIPMTWSESNLGKKHGAQ